MGLKRGPLGNWPNAGRAMRAASGVTVAPQKRAAPGQRTEELRVPAGTPRISRRGRVLLFLARIMACVAPSFCPGGHATTCARCAHVGAHSSTPGLAWGNASRPPLGHWRHTRFACGGAGLRPHWLHWWARISTSTMHLYILRFRSQLPPRFYLARAMEVASTMRGGAGAFANTLGLPRHGVWGGRPGPQRAPGYGGLLPASPCFLMPGMLNASAGNRTQVTSMATMYSTTRPLMLVSCSRGFDLC
jgi:hypothetical protein